MLSCTLLHLDNATGALTLTSCSLVLAALPLQTEGQAGPYLLPRALAMLPAGLNALEFSSYCRADTPAALARFTRLQRLRLSGNAWEVEWAQPPAQALLPLLQELRLRYCDFQPPAVQGGIFTFEWALPDDVAPALMAATRLERLELQIAEWSGAVPQLCEALPALRELRWVAWLSDVLLSCSSCICCRRQLTSYVPALCAAWSCSPI